jgi:hypothetical protein
MKPSSETVDATWAEFVRNVYQAGGRKRFSATSVTSWSANARKTRYAVLMRNWSNELSNDRAIRGIQLPVSMIARAVVM